MNIQDDIPNALFVLFIFILSFPELHLIFIFFIVEIRKLFNKIIELLACIYDIFVIIILSPIVFMIQNPIILAGLIIYLAIFNP